MAYEMQPHVSQKLDRHVRTCIFEFDPKESWLGFRYQRGSRWIAQAPVHHTQRVDLWIGIPCLHVHYTHVRNI